jgi:hypothetical protein
MMIYLHPSGKSAEASPGGEIEKLVNQRITVLAPDLIGIGEMGPGALRGDAYFKGVSHNLWYASMLIGRSITGIQAGDVVRLVQLIKRNNSEAEIIGYGKGEICPVLLHAAAFSTDIKSLILVEPYSSFLSIVLNRFYDPLLVMSSVPGALEYYDLLDLASAIAPRKLILAGVLDGNSSTADSLRIKNDLAVIQASYKRLNAGDSLKIIRKFNSF